MYVQTVWQSGKQNRHPRLLEELPRGIIRTPVIGSGTPIAKFANRTKVNKVNRVMPATGVSGVLGEASSHGFKRQAVALSGNGVSAGRSVERAIVAGLLIDVLTRLGGASQVDQQPAFVLVRIQRARIKLLFIEWRLA